jgi:hypothetical protein
MHQAFFFGQLQLGLALIDQIIIVCNDNIIRFISGAMDPNGKKT